MDGATAAAKDTVNGFIYGPYMQAIPTNPLVLPADASKIVDGTAAAANYGFVYDYNGGLGSGKVWGIDSAGALVQQ